MKSFFKNPLTLWLKWYYKSKVLEYKNRNNNLKIGYMSEIFNSKFGKYTTIYKNVSIAGAVIDDYVYIGNNTKISRTTIGKFCSIGADVKIGLALHPTNYFTTFPAFYSMQKQCQVFFTDRNHFKETGKNVIGNDVWIGENATVLSDLTIGDGAIIAAGAVVTKDVEPYSIVGGVPAKHIKYRFDKNICNELLELEWWNKDIDWINDNMPNKVKV